MTPAAAGDAFGASALAASSPHAERRLGQQDAASPSPFADDRLSAHSLPSPTFRLCCSDVLPVHCDASWRSSSREDVIHSARQHGANVHGFTAVWYDADRLAAMAQAVTG